VIDSKYFILNHASKVTKFDSKSIKKIFIGYSSISKPYRIYILILWILIEYVHVKFDESTNFGAKKGHSIVGSGAKNINAINKNQAIIIENI
jgi:hypothetical protein